LTKAKNGEDVAGPLEDIVAGAYYDSDDQDEGISEYEDDDDDEDNDDENEDSEDADTEDNDAAYPNNAKGSAPATSELRRSSRNRSET
jgi:hypothetical protein